MARSVLLVRVQLPFVVALFADVTIQIALLVVQLLVGLVQARAVALQRALVALQLAEIALELRLVLRGQVVANCLPVALQVFLGPCDRLAIALHGLPRLAYGRQVMADVLTLVLDVLLQAG